MKKLLTALLLICSTMLFAQNDVTKFMGIPVDGSKHEMIEKLKAKGFRSSDLGSDWLEGEFNGQQVSLLIQTVNNKVWRICIQYFTSFDESNIRINFNNLCFQFDNNDKYYNPESYGSYLIPEDEDISYNINVNNKRYDAYFYQNSDSDELISSKYKRLVWFILDSNYGMYSINLYYENGYNEASGQDL